MSYYSKLKEAMLRRMDKQLDLVHLVDHFVVDMNEKKKEPMYVVYVHRKIGDGVAYDFKNHSLKTNLNFLSDDANFVSLKELMEKAIPVFRAKRYTGKNGEAVEVQHCYKLGDKCYLAYTTTNGENGTYSLVNNAPSILSHKVQPRPEVKQDYLNQFQANKEEVLEYLTEVSFQLKLAMMEETERDMDNGGDFEDQYYHISEALGYFMYKNPELVKEEEPTLEMQKK